jgi:hypothetical protein
MAKIDCFKSVQKGWNVNNSRPVSRKLQPDFLQTPARFLKKLAGVENPYLFFQN